MQKKWRFVLLLLGFLTMFNLWSQERTTQFNGFGHFEYQLNNNKQRLENLEEYKYDELDTNGVEQDHVETFWPPVNNK